MSPLARARWDRDHEAYEEVVRRATALFAKKNHDYAGSWKLAGAAWFIDDLRTKLARIEHLETGSAQVADEKQQDTALDIINEAILFYIKLVLRDGDANYSAATLAQNRRNELRYLERQVQDGVLGLDVALEALTDFDACWPGAKAAWEAELWSQAPVTHGEEHDGHESPAEPESAYDTSGAELIYGPPA